MALKASKMCGRKYCPSSTLKWNCCSSTRWSVGRRLRLASWFSFWPFFQQLIKDVWKKILPFVTVHGVVPSFLCIPPLDNMIFHNVVCDSWFVNRKQWFIPTCSCNNKFTDLSTSVLCSLRRVPNMRPVSPMYRRWAGKTSYVHLAHEYEYRAKHPVKANKN